MTDLSPTQAAADAALETAKGLIQDIAEMSPVRFAIDSEERANWLLRRLGNLEAEEARVRAQADEILSGLRRDRESLRARFDVELRAWAECALQRQRSKTKTLKLLQGSISFRTAPGGIRITDPAAATAFAVTHAPDRVEMRPHLLTDAYRALALASIAETGELLPGITIAPEEECMYIRFPGKKEPHAEI